MANEISFKMPKISGYLKNKKLMYLLVAVLLLAIIIFGMWIRFQSLDILKDVTTGEFIPTALDPFYFLRIAETMISDSGLPEFDNMRYVPAKLSFSNEITPDAVVLLYKIANIFGDFSIQYINVISPVVFFGLSLIVFFFLTYFLTKSKITALISSFFLSVIPIYFHRTSTGFSDHESIGMLVFFSVILAFTFSLKFLEKNRDNLMKILGLGILVGFLTSLTIAAWGGIANFIFMIFPLSFFVFWVLKVKNIGDRKSLNSLLVFYPTWLISGIFLTLMYGYSLLGVIEKYTLSTSGIISLFVLGFIFVDYFFIYFKGNLKFLKGKEKYRIFFSIIATILLGVIFLLLQDRSIFSLLSNLFERFLNPFGTGRTGLTVAENAATSLNQWMGQIGKTFFWLFYFGIIFLGVEMSKGIEKKKDKVIFILLWTFMISGILFSRISSSSLLNGTNFISKAFYFSGLILFFLYVSRLYLKENISIKPELIVTASWIFFMIIAARGAVRLFFPVTPIVVFMGSFFVVKLFDYWRSSKDDFLKIFLIVILIISVVGMAMSANDFANNSIAQAKNSGPSASYQWQKAMSWIRDNTEKGSIFVHWWDYGYWVQYLGQRPTVTDGGHGVGYWDHLIGRYLLTTPNPESALSFMKTQGVSYLLIDPSDFGKYPAYSKIGSDEEATDRYSQIPLMVIDPSQTIEKEGQTTRVYQGGVHVDEDIIYGENEEVFLPEGKAIAAGVVLIESTDGGGSSFAQPQEVFVYNQKQVNIPVRYLYYQEELIDFGGGLDAVIMIIPQIFQNNNQQVNIDFLGTAVYLSPKVSKSLFAQLYLLDNSFGKYETVSLAHAEQDPIVSNINSQGANVGDFAYFHGLRGPIKIWKVDYPSNILVKEEFLRTSGEYGEFDNLKFVV